MNMEDKLYYYKAVVLRVLDGDTVELAIDTGFRNTYTSTCRFYGLNAPETKTKNAQEKEKGMITKQFVIDSLPLRSVIMVKSVDLDKYGRPLIDVYCGEGFLTHLNSVMLEKGLAVPMVY